MKWMFKDLEVLASGNYTTAVLARMFGVSAQEISNTIKEYGIDAPVQKYARWTKREEDILREMAKQGKSSKEMSRAIRRGVIVVENRLKVLGVNIRKKRFLTDDEKSMIILKRTMGVPFKEIAACLGRSVASVAGAYYREMGN